jgi:hypothetical protein
MESGRPGAQCEPGPWQTSRKVTSQRLTLQDIFAGCSTFVRMDTPECRVQEVETRACRRSIDRSLCGGGGAAGLAERPAANVKSKRTRKFDPAPQGTVHASSGQRLRWSADLGARACGRAGMMRGIALLAGPASCRLRQAAARQPIEFAARERPIALDPMGLLVALRACRVTLLRAWCRPSSRLARRTAPTCSECGGTSTRASEHARACRLPSGWDRRSCPRRPLPSAR